MAYDYCRCHNEPRGLNGLEGFQRSEVYAYRKCSEPSGREFIRVYLDGKTAEHGCCGPLVFKRYFTKISKDKVPPNKIKGEKRHWDCVVTYEVDSYNVQANSKEHLIQIIKEQFKNEHNITLEDGEIHHIKEV